MVPYFDPHNFNAQTLRSCFQYIIDAFQWLTAGGAGFFEYVYTSVS